MAETDLSNPGVQNRVRDTQLDIYRALMMIYIPCFIHVLYWLGMNKEPWGSIALFEMPVIFFISGATMYVTGKKDNIFETFKNRGKRLLLPFYIYALVCLLLCIVLCLYTGDFLIDKSHILRIVFVQDGFLPVIPYLAHIWFIVPFILVSCSFAIQQKWADRINRWMYMGILMIICLVFHLAPEAHKLIYKIIREAVFYNFFFMAGYLFYKRISLKSLCCVVIISALAVGIWWISYTSTGKPVSMQAHKFPPDLLFLSYGVLAISVLSLIFGSFKLPVNKLFNHWNKYGYTIYLWQNISFWIYVVILTKWGLKDFLHPSLGHAILAGISIFLISTLTSLLIVPVESKIAGLILNRKKSKKGIA